MNRSYTLHRLLGIDSPYLPALASSEAQLLARKVSRRRGCRIYSVQIDRFIESEQDGSCFKLQTDYPTTKV